MENTQVIKVQLYEHKINSLTGKLIKIKKIELIKSEAEPKGENNVNK